MGSEGVHNIKENWGSVGVLMGTYTTVMGF